MNLAEVTIGHTPDADDAFMFYALTQGIVSSPLLKIEHAIKSIQLLNEDARNGKYEMSALSFGAFPAVSEKYSLMSCGACMGFKTGPMILAKQQYELKDLKNVKIAVPGKQTTAYLVLQIALPNADTVVLPFDQIVPAIEKGEVQAGLVISEAQLTHERLGLAKVVDLGAWWYNETQLPLPLGGNVFRKDLPGRTKSELTRVFKESIRYALSHREEAVQFAMRYARSMDDAEALDFIGRYVNEFTVDYGEVGRLAVETLYRKAFESGALQTIVNFEFETTPV
jgi:1,4-dihydroxy-6-naphthoate synthase